jgi:hypothetical protein
VPHFDRTMSNALGWLRRRHAPAWVGVLALLIQLIVPAAHDAHDIADAFAKAGAQMQSHAPGEIARVALILLEQHRQGSRAPGSGHLHGVGRHQSPGGSHHHSGGGAGSLPCSVWQASQAASNFVVPVFPVFDLPALLPVARQADQIGAVRRNDRFSHPQSHAPPRSV